MSSCSLRLAAATIVATAAYACTAPAGAQLLVHKALTAAIAMTIAQTAIEACKSNRYAVSATVAAETAKSSCRCAATTPHQIPWKARSARPLRARRELGEVARC